MFRRSFGLVSSMAIAVALLAGAGSARAGMAPLDQSITVNQAAGDATFMVDFAHVPNFSANSQGQQVDTFEYEIAANPKGSSPLSYANLTTIIWGNDIHSTHAITFRNASPPALTDPNSGGWGTIRGTVPFTVTGDKLTFTAPLTLLGAPDGKFAYLAFTQSSGSQQSTATGQTVPLPPAIGVGLIMLAFGIAISIRKTMIARAR